MAEYMQLEVVTPERVVLSRRVEEVVAPGAAGEFGALPGHTPFLTTLRAGQVIAKAEDKDIYLAVGGGFAEVTGSRVIILAETADRAEDIDIDQARKDLEIAQGKVDSLSNDDPAYNKWAERLRRAEVKIMVAETVAER
ncbi:MAG: F0F1 ATP synthase subunit epsilon [Thermodesulfobacteriota bacterium]|nr:F0F1 ATP synthase subunit epsilon [Thermodesulfobacteriota bacterium]